MRDMELWSEGGPRLREKTTLRQWKAIENGSLNNQKSASKATKPSMGETIFKITSRNMSLW